MNYVIGILLGISMSSFYWWRQFKKLENDMGEALAELVEIVTKKGSKTCK